MTFMVYKGAGGGGRTTGGNIKPARYRGNSPAAVRQAARMGGR
jgi:hypothetical protein